MSLRALLDNYHGGVKPIPGWVNRLRRRPLPELAEDLIKGPCLVVPRASIPMFDKVGRALHSPEGKILGEEILYHRRR